MTEQCYASCKYFETTGCPDINSKTMQRIFSPDSIYKGSSSNIADDWDILDAIDTCANCDNFEYKQT